jgi:hypothetical protein
MPSEMNVMRGLQAGDLERLDNFLLDVDSRDAMRAR